MLRQQNIFYTWLNICIFIVNTRLTDEVVFMTETQVQCKYCEKIVEFDQSFFLYRLITATDKNVYITGITKVLAEISDFAAEKYYHLSGSEILLLRPDIVKIYLQTKYNENILAWHLDESQICLDCYGCYNEIIPLR